MTGPQRLWLGLFILALEWFSWAKSDAQLFISMFVACFFLVLFFNSEAT